MKTATLINLAASAVLAQQSIDVTSKDAVLSAAKSAMKWLQYFYSPNPGSGYWDEKVVQWHESGEYYGLFYNYRAISGDATYDAFVDSQMILNTVGGDFMDGNNPLLATSGRWNDDISWWALSTMTAAEIWGPTGVVMPSDPSQGGATYLSIVNATWNEVWEDWDTKTCNGGLYWSRDRNAAKLNQRYYKSTVSNVQYMHISARLYAMTGDEQFRQRADQVYAWLKSSGLITPTFVVYDGYQADDPNDCGSTKLNNAVWSYQLGELISAHSFLYTKTKDPKYLTEAMGFFGTVQSQFVQNGIIVEPTCTAQPGFCKNPGGYTWALYQSLPDLHAATSDPATKTAIETMLRASASANFQGCGADWNCIRTLNPVPSQYTFTNGTNPRDQFETVYLLNALAKVNGASQIMTQTQTLGTGGAAASSGDNGGSASSSGQGAAPQGASGGMNKIYLYAGIGGGVIGLVLVSIIVYYCIQISKKKSTVAVKEYNSREIYQDAQIAGRSNSRSSRRSDEKRSPAGYHLDDMHDSRHRHKQIVAQNQYANAPPQSPQAYYGQQPPQGYAQGQQVYPQGQPYAQGYQGYPQQQQYGTPQQNYQYRARDPRS
ncbi:glycosyl hydrolase family 76-domain-containing protein [Chytriomyces sp. MP71]|nr:glycosyl hydrolase family 76-domain-containing protein [Chytriomyces sp. MP71]